MCLASAILPNSYPYYPLKVADGLILRGPVQGQEGARALDIGVQAALQVARRAALQPHAHHCFHVPRRTAPPLHLNFTEMSKVDQYNQTGWKKHEFAQILFHFLS